MLLIPSKILKIGAVLHLITSVEIDGNSDVRNFDVLQGPS